MFSPSFLFFFFAFAFGPLCLAQPLQSRATEDQFNIYAFGDGIDGLQVYYMNNMAAIGDPEQASVNASTPVYFTVSSSAAYTWIAHPQSSYASWSTKLLYMGNDASKEVGFAAPANTTGKLVNEWWRYGQYVMTEVSGANFYAEAMSGVSGWYTLSWSATDEVADGKILLTLRTIAPSTDSVLT